MNIKLKNKADQDVTLTFKNNVFTLTRQGQKNNDVNTFYWFQKNELKKELAKCRLDSKDLKKTKEDIDNMNTKIIKTVEEFEKLQENLNSYPKYVKFFIDVKDDDNDYIPTHTPMEITAIEDNLIILDQEFFLNKQTFDNLLKNGQVEECDVNESSTNRIVNNNNNKNSFRYKYEKYSLNNNIINHLKRENIYKNIKINELQINDYVILFELYVENDNNASLINPIIDVLKNLFNNKYHIDVIQEEENIYNIAINNTSNNEGLTENFPLTVTFTAQIVDKNGQQIPMDTILEITYKDNIKVVFDDKYVLNRNDFQWYIDNGKIEVDGYDETNESFKDNYVIIRKDNGKYFSRSGNNINWTDNFNLAYSYTPEEITSAADMASKEANVEVDCKTVGSLMTTENTSNGELCVLVGKDGSYFSNYFDSINNSNITSDVNKAKMYDNQIDGTRKDNFWTYKSVAKISQETNTIINTDEFSHGRTKKYNEPQPQTKQDKINAYKEIEKKRFDDKLKNTTLSELEKEKKELEIVLKQLKTNYPGHVFYYDAHEDNINRIQDKLYYTNKLINAKKSENVTENTSNALLTNFDLNDLDQFEEFIYNDYIKNMSKEEALQVIINNVEGDFSQLSPKLAEVAEQLNGMNDNTFNNENEVKGYRLLSPDGIDIEQEKIYDTLEEVETAFNKWKKRFEMQGYYSSNNGRIDLRDLADEMKLITLNKNGVTESMFNNNDQETDSPNFVKGDKVSTGTGIKGSIIEVYLDDSYADVLVNYNNGPVEPYVAQYDLDFLTKLDNENKLRNVTVYFDNDDQLTTSMAAHLTDDDIKNYYQIGKSFNVGMGQSDSIAKVKSIVINENIDYNKNTTTENINGQELKIQWNGYIENPDENEEWTIEVDGIDQNSKLYTGIGTFKNDGTHTGLLINVKNIKEQ